MDIARLRSLYYARFTEAIVALCGGIVFGASKNDMIEKFDINGASSVPQLSGDLDVG